MTTALEMVFTLVKTTCSFELFAHQIWSTSIKRTSRSLSHISSYLASVCFAMPHCHLSIPGLDFPWHVFHCPTQQLSRCADLPYPSAHSSLGNTLPSSAGTSLFCLTCPSTHLHNTPTKSPSVLPGHLSKLCIYPVTMCGTPVLCKQLPRVCSHHSFLDPVPLCTGSSQGRLTTNSFILLTSMAAL